MLFLFVLLCFVFSLSASSSVFSGMHTMHGKLPYNACSDINYLHYSFSCLKKEFLVKLLVSGCSKLIKSITCIFAFVCTSLYKHSHASQALLFKKVFTTGLLARMKFPSHFHTSCNKL